MSLRISKPSLHFSTDPNLNFSFTMNKLILALACTLALAMAVSAKEQTCGFNEVYQQCASNCPIHCPVRNARTGLLEDGSERACILMCRQGCDCAHGYVRDLKRNGACVEKALCSSP